MWKWSGAAQIRILAEFAGFIHPFPSTYFMAHSTSIASVMKYVKCKASQLLLFLTLCPQWQSQTQTWACLPLKVVPHCPPSLVSLESRADGDTHCPGGKQSTGGRENPPGPRLEGLCGGFRMMGGISTEMRREGEVRGCPEAEEMSTVRFQRPCKPW